MPVPGLGLEAYLIVDNCMLSMLCDYWCHSWAVRTPPAHIVPTVCQWFTDQFNTLRQFTPDGLLHCTDGVAGEFKPHAGQLSEVRGIRHGDCQQVQTHVSTLLNRVGVDMDAIPLLRGLPNAPRKLIGPDGLSDNDFSLVVLGLQLTAGGGQVYILTNDQDLLSFISWVRTRPEVRRRWGNVQLIQGLQSLTYLELVHRNCQIATDKMQDLLNFSMMVHYERRELSGTTKGHSIMQQLLEVNRSLAQSIEIKATAKGSVP
jgi:hypothetical protein